MLLDLDQFAGLVFGSDLRARGHEVDPAHRLVVLANIVIAFGAAVVVVERHARADDIDEGCATVAQRALDQGHQLLLVARESARHIGCAKLQRQPDQVDLLVTLEERPTGNLQVGAGYSNAERLTLSGSIQQDNVMGSGHYLGINLNTSRYNRTAVLSTVDPYFTVDGISRGLDVYYRTSRPLNSIGDQYQLATPGASIRFGVPFTENDTVFFGLGIERTEIRATSAIPNSYYLFREQFGAVSNAVPLTLGWQRDSRDSVLTPTLGRYQRGNFEWSLADRKSTRLNSSH